MDNQQVKKSNWFDINKFKLSEDSKYVIYEIPVGISIDMEPVKDYIISIYHDVELKIVRDSPVYWLKCFKK